MKKLIAFYRLWVRHLAWVCWGVTSSRLTSASCSASVCTASDPRLRECFMSPRLCVDHEFTASLCAPRMLHVSVCIVSSPPLCVNRECLRVVCVHTTSAPRLCVSLCTASSMRLCVNRHCEFTASLCAPRVLHVSASLCAPRVHRISMCTTNAPRLCVHREFTASVCTASAPRLRVSVCTVSSLRLCALRVLHVAASLCAPWVHHVCVCTASAPHLCMHRECSVSLRVLHPRLCVHRECSTSPHRCVHQYSELTASLSASSLRLCVHHLSVSLCAPQMLRVFVCVSESPTNRWRTIPFYTHHERTTNVPNCTYYLISPSKMTWLQAVRKRLSHKVVMD